MTRLKFYWRFLYLSGCRLTVAGFIRTPMWFRELLSKSEYHDCEAALLEERIEANDEE